MSRSGYSDECENVGLWRANVDRAIAGERGQKLLRDMLVALDAMPVKRLIEGAIQESSGDVCALGSVALLRKMDVTDLDECERDDVAKAFGIAPTLAAEVAYINDEYHRGECVTLQGPREQCTYDRWGGGYSVFVPETPEERFVRVRAWVIENLSRPPQDSPTGRHE